jgi:NAD(P)-dependent dehydrogenase (short-subunit alcohol dehydrogenase family)
VASAAQEVRERFGGLDVLINNAGISGGIGAVEEVVAMALIGTDGRAGSFTDRHGAVGW